MAGANITVRLKPKGFRKVRELMKVIDPGLNDRIMNQTLLRIAARMMAQLNTGKVFRRGKRHSKALPTKLTSRRAGAGLMGSIFVQKGGLPRSISVGTPWPQGGVHEAGGTVRFKAHTVSAHKVKAHTRNGVRVKAGSRGRHKRGPRTATYPARPFIARMARPVLPKMADIAIEVIIEEAFGA